MTTTEESQTVKISIRLDGPIYAALQTEGRGKGRDIGDHIQRILADHVIDQKLMDEATGIEYAMKESLIDRAVDTAIRIIREGRFGPDITYKTFGECMENKQWAEDYEAYVQDNPYKHGNPRKSPINQDIGSRIRKAIGGKVTKLDGKTAKTPVTGSVIQSYTPMVSFNSDAVGAIA